MNRRKISGKLKKVVMFIRISEAQKKMKKRYVKNGYAYILCNDYDKICKAVHEYMKGIRVPCKYCNKLFLNKETLKTHYKIIHRIEK